MLISSKSGGNTPSPNTPDASGMPPSFSQSQQRQKSASSYQSGVDTPDRFVTHCEPPPALSQRHLVDKLVGAAAEMEISRKDNEDGQRDHIRSDANEMRVDDGQHMIPSGRNLVITSPSPNDHLQPNGEEQKGKGKPVPSPNPRRLSHSQAQSQARARSRSRSQTRRPAPMDRSESKAKAFAFFGQVS
jgi:NAD+ kinase